MGIDSEELDLAALADAAGVTTRTVRYYVSQGLLPSPGTRGPGTKYDRALIDRLQLIKLLQQKHWPLAKIRLQLETLDENGVREALGAPPELPLSDSALTYVRGVIGERDAPPPRTTAAALRVPGRPPQPHVRESQDLFGAPEPKQSKWDIRRSTWERIRIAPDVELALRRPLTPDMNKLVDRLLDAARDFFAESEKKGER